MEVYDSKGSPVLLGSVLGRGGEGSVYSVDNNTDIVAKIYEKPPDIKKRDKLKAMVQFKNERLLKAAAWPIDTLHNEAEGAEVGILMERLDGYKEIHKLYGPKSRLIEIPHAGWDFLIHTAANLARAFYIIHGSGHIIGDINPGNIAVSGKATVKLIDCDSFQISNDGEIYTCNVGMPIYQPPELQDIKTFEGLVRTEEHDNFGLAVIIFQLLFMGRHPFSASYRGTGDMPLERAIGEKRFAYSKAGESKYIRQPPGTMTLKALPDFISDLFERAFLTEKRPSAKEWISALDELLKHISQCSKDPSHKYPDTFRSCPWCKVEGRIGAVLFSQAAGLYGTEDYIDVEQIWKSANEIPSPGPPPDVPEYMRLGSEKNGSKKSSKLRIMWIFSSLGVGTLSLSTGLGMVLGAAGAAAALMIPAAAVSVVLIKNRSIKRRRQSEGYKRERECLEMYINIRDKDGWDQRFLDKRSELSKIYESYKELEISREKRLRAMRMDKDSKESIKEIDREFIKESNKIGKALLEGMEDLKAIVNRADIRRQRVTLEIEKHYKILKRM